MKHILSVTGTRADYGIYRPIYQSLEAHPDVELSLVPIGMHLRPEFGNTIEEIRADNFSIVAEIDTLTTEDTPRSIAEFSARTTAECIKIFDEQHPDIVLILGDRVEMLAAAVAAYELGLPIAHIHGGEFTGTLDEGRRHAITQLSGLHLTTAERHSDNVHIMKPREDLTNIITVGAPALDTVTTFSPTPKEELIAGIPEFDATLPMVVLVQHPDTDDKMEPLDQLLPALEALKDLNANVLIIGSNADAGGVRMNEMLQQYATSRDHTHFIVSLPHAQFLSWEAAADVLVGNSSSGIIEAASQHLPVVNIGKRQDGRLRSGNVLDVDYDKDQISAALDTVFHDQSFKQKVASCKNVYWHGGAAEKVTQALLSFS